MISGYHSWYITSHARPVFCNVCKEALQGVTSHGLSCGGKICCCHNLYCMSCLPTSWLIVSLTAKYTSSLVFAVCRFKSHKLCANRAPPTCKWSTLASIGKHIIEDPDGSIGKFYIPLNISTNGRSTASATGLLHFLDLMFHLLALTSKESVPHPVWGDFSLL